MKFFKDNQKLLIKMTLTLFVITAASTLLLAGVHALTLPGITENARKKTALAMEAIIPGGEFSTEPVYTSDEAEVYGASIGGSSAGYCVVVAPVGFKAEINMMVGVNKDGNIIGVKIISMSETAGLGTKVQDPDFLSRFNNLSGSVAIGQGEGKVEAVTGATISSKAVTLGVNQALTAVRDYELGGASS